LLQFSAPFGHGRPEVVIGCVRRCVLDTRRRSDKQRWDRGPNCARLPRSWQIRSPSVAAEMLLLDASRIDSFTLNGA
ncbi:hypothetical protein ACLBYD_27695, partial [Rhodococcus sp. C26F]